MVDENTLHMQIYKYISYGKVVFKYVDEPGKGTTKFGDIKSMPNQMGSSCQLGDHRHLKMCGSFTKHYNFFQMTLFPSRNAHSPIGNNTWLMLRSWRPHKDITKIWILKAPWIFKIWVEDWMFLQKIDRSKVWEGKSHSRVKKVSRFPWAVWVYW